MTKHTLSSKSMAVAKSMPTRQKQPRLPNFAVNLLKSWLFAPEHINNPYPTKEEKKEMLGATKGAITLKQLENWFINARRRTWENKRNNIQQSWLIRDESSVDKDFNLNDCPHTAKDLRTHSIIPTSNSTKQSGFNITQTPVTHTLPLKYLWEGEGGGWGNIVEGSGFHSPRSVLHLEPFGLYAPHDLSLIDSLPKPDPTSSHLSDFIFGHEVENAKAFDFSIPKTNNSHEVENKAETSRNNKTEDCTLKQSTNEQLGDVTKFPEQFFIRDNPLPKASFIPALNAKEQGELLHPFPACLSDITETSPLDRGWKNPTDKTSVTSVKNMEKCKHPLFAEPIGPEDLLKLLEATYSECEPRDP